MYLIDKLAEEKITEAIKRGELDNRSGTGKTLHLDDEVLKPEALRVGFRLLKKSGYLPPGWTCARKSAATTLPPVATECRNPRHASVNRAALSG